MVRAKLISMELLHSESYWMYGSNYFIHRSYNLLNGSNSLECKLLNCYAFFISNFCDVWFFRDC
jgi:hypothetical protein